MWPNGARSEVPPRPSALRLHPTSIGPCQVRLAGATAPDTAHRMQRLNALLGTRSIWREDDRCLEIALDEG